MPLDGSRYFGGQPRYFGNQLHVAVSRAALDPIPDAVLCEHKAEQLRLNQPGWLYEYRFAVQLSAIFMAIALLVITVLLMADARYVSGAGALICLMVFLLFMDSGKLVAKGPPVWQETPVKADLGLALAPDGIPVRVWGAMARLQAELPEVEFKMGRMMREEIVIDPYIVAKYGNTEICLGIWEGDDVIMCA